MTLRLFVYGTLQPGAGTRMGRWIEQRLVRSEAASVSGRLFALRVGDGWFPALVPAKSGRRVKGTVCELALEPGEIALLDRYEGGEYRRLAAQVRTYSRATLTAQLYRWRIALPECARPIASGDFLGWLREERLNAFSTPRKGS